MSSTSTIILEVPRGPTESMFLQAVIQAAIHAYRNDLMERHNVNADIFEEDPNETTTD